jgi:hypothetical protein
MAKTTKTTKSKFEFVCPYTGKVFDLKTSDMDEIKEYITVQEAIAEKVSEDKKLAAIKVKEEKKLAIQKFHESTNVPELKDNFIELWKAFNKTKTKPRTPPKDVKIWFESGDVHIEYHGHGHHNTIPFNQSGLVWRSYNGYTIQLHKLKHATPPVKVEKISMDNKELVHSNHDYAEHLAHYNKVVEEIKANKALIRLLHDEMMQIKNKVLGSSTEKFWI